MFIPLEPTFGERFKHGKVTGIHPSDKKVTLESGEEVSYDILVLATGTTGNFPNKLKPDMQQNREELKKEYNTLTEKVLYCFQLSNNLNNGHFVLVRHWIVIIIITNINLM